MLNMIIFFNKTHLRTFCFKLVTSGLAAEELNLYCILRNEFQKLHLKVRVNITYPQFRNELAKRVKNTLHVVNHQFSEKVKIPFLRLMCLNDEGRYIKSFQ